MKSSYIIALVIALAAAAWLASPYIGGRPETANGAPSVAQANSANTQAKEALKVQVRHSVAEKRVHSLVLTGQTEASREATIKSETAGRVVAVDAEEGASVKQGDVIVRLAMDDRKALLSEAEALVKQRQIEYSAASKLSSKGFQTQTRLAETKANLEAAQARLRQIQVDIDRTVIRAPFDSVIQTRVVELGDYVGVGDPVAQVIDLDPLITAAQVSEREIAGVKTGDEGKIRLITGDVVDGRVRYVSSVASGGTRTFRIELEIDNPENRLSAGLTAEVRLPVDSVEAHNMSPAALTLNDAGVIGVKIVDVDGIVHFRPVKLVSDGADGVWIAGLPKEADIITVGQEFVMDGQKVTPVPEDRVPTPSEILSRGAS
jgi:multidrug efflux system membrane fusion protein